MRVAYDVLVHGAGRVLLEHWNIGALGALKLKVELGRLPYKHLEWVVSTKRVV